MKIEKNKVVSLSYELNAEDENGTVFLVESVKQAEPLVFLFGASGFPEKFEDELDGMNENEDFNFKLTIEEAYGYKDEQAIVKLPKDIFLEDGKFDESRFKPGTIVPMSDADGNIMPSKILNVGDAELLMDFNHPLAGLNLHFTGHIQSVRNATREEIEHGHVHGLGGHHH
jgi:FKBP-type peptidyl-prolyl cis-trans isomerase SlyD